MGLLKVAIRKRGMLVDPDFRVGVRVGRHLQTGIGGMFPI